MKVIGPILECKKISKTFPGVKALENVDFRLFGGEIHGLVGENGAGKSTLVRIFAGVYSNDVLESSSQGGLFFEGKRVVFKNPNDALKSRIVMIHQELNVVPDLMVYENIFLNKEIKRFGLLDKKQMIEKTKKMIENFEAGIEPTDIVKNLSVDKQKLVEVLRALSQEIKVLIMDEPTSVLIDTEAQHLFKVMKNIANKGMSIIFISHNLPEIVSHCDRVTILRDGKIITTLEKKELNIDKIIMFMVGKKLSYYSQINQTSKTGEELFNVCQIQHKNLVKNVSFNVKKGEILGITGLVGSGGTELAKTLFGAEGYRKEKGKIFLNGKEIFINTPVDAIKNRISLITKDRKNEGLFLNFNIIENICMATIKKFQNRIKIIDKKKQIISAIKYIKLLNIKIPGIDVATELLSGGNQQKVVIAKWLETEPDVFIMDEPTIGVDVATKQEIRKIIQQLAHEKKSIILITNEYAELQTLCDRVLIMFKGEIIKELYTKDLMEETLLSYSLGGLKT